MLKKISAFLENQQQKRVLKDFTSEITKNLETCYVVQQLDQPRLFSLASWEKAHSLAAGDWSAEILQYVERLKQFNAVLKQTQEYERWYADDVARQNQETAKLLHDRKEFVQEKFAGLEAVIKLAQISFNNFLF